LKTIVPIDPSICNHPVEDKIALRINRSLIRFLNTKLRYGIQCHLPNKKPMDPLLSITLRIKYV